ncbi:MAG: hypothetical protein AAF957_15665 [Planctomycetota bacterium]
MTLLDDTDRTRDRDPDLDALEARFAALTAASETLPVAERTDGLAALERDLLLHECRSVAAQGAEQHPVLGVALGWEDRLRRAGCPDEARAVEAVGAELMIRRLRERERAAIDALECPPDSLGPSDRDRLLDALLAVEELRQRVEGRAGPLGSTGALDARAVCEDADDVLVRLRAAFLRALAAAPASAATRRRWTGRLVDLADETIVRVGEHSSRLSARLLGEAKKALEWHLEHVETERTDERRRLAKRARRLESERVEEEVQAGLERRFGKRAVELWERGVVVAIVLVVALLAHDLVRGPSAWSVPIDTTLCGFLLYDFFVRASFARFQWSWLRRHILTDFVAVLPYAWLATLDTSNAAPSRYGRLVVLIRTLRIGQTVRFALPLIRLFRAFTFLVRGLDRIVRSHSKLLENEVLLFPTLEERRRSKADAATVGARVWRLRSDLDGRFSTRFEGGTQEERTRLAAARLDALRTAAKEEVATHDVRKPRSARRESLPLAERWLLRVGAMGSEELEGRVGREAVGRIATGARLVARSPLRFLPLLGRWAPADAADLPDRRVASRTVRAVARSLRTAHRRVLWWADLRGTLTPGEIVGRVGATLVARTSRPAVRLLLFGALYLVLLVLLDLLGVDTSGSRAAEEDGLGAFLSSVFLVVKRIVLGFLAVLGSICLALLSVGVWLQRMARDATTFHEQVARAQFLHLTDSIKARQRVADARLLADRVFRLERGVTSPEGAHDEVQRDAERFVASLEAFLAKGVSPPSRDAGFDAVARSIMLYRDLLDGALLTSSDTRATSQLLGNLAIQRMARGSGRVTPELRKRLRAIDLERRRTFVRGPYLWFHSVSRALSSRAARLIVDYNAHAVPLAELSRMRSDARARYEAWLDCQPTTDDELGAPGSAPQLTTAFTLLHFLDDSETRDAEIAARFGDRVLERMRRDRRTLVRTVFGTYPLHRLPLEQRVLNLRAVYAEWIEGGRILLLPFRTIGLASVLAWRGLRVLARAVSMIREPERALAVARDAEADFTAAARKVGRMRAPGALAALHLRAVLDPEAHGLALPLMPAPVASEAPSAQEEGPSRRTPVAMDAEFLGAGPSFLDVLAALEARAVRNLERIRVAAEGGLLERIGAHLEAPIENDRETLRALVVLIHSDADGLRAELFGEDVLVEATVDALEYGLPAAGGLPPLPLWLRFRRWWRSMGGRERVEAAVRASGVVAMEPDPELGELSDARRRQFERALVRRLFRATWRVLAADVDGARACLARAVEGHGVPAEVRRDAGEARLADALRHPTRVTEQLATLRAVQTFALVDVRNYRRQVWSLGQYASENDPGDALLDLPAT